MDLAELRVAFTGDLAGLTSILSEGRSQLQSFRDEAAGLSSVEFRGDTAPLIAAAGEGKSQLASFKEEAAGLGTVELSGKTEGLTAAVSEGKSQLASFKEEAVGLGAVEFRGDVSGLTTATEEARSEVDFFRASAAEGANVLFTGDAAPLAATIGEAEGELSSFKAAAETEGRVTLTADSAPLVAGMGQAETAATGFAGAAAGAEEKTAGMGVAMEETAGRAEAASGGMGILEGAIGGTMGATEQLAGGAGLLALAAGFAITGDEIVKSNIQFDKSSAALTLLTGSADTAREHLEQIEKLGLEGGFSIPGLEAADQKLVGAGIDAEKVIPVLKSVAESTYAIGTGQQGIDQVSDALKRMSDMGEVTARPMLALVNNGVPIYKELAQVLGTDVAGAMEAVKQKSVDVDTVFEAIQQGSEQFGGQMEAHATTFEGAVGRIRASVEVLGTTAFRGLFESLTGVGNMLADYTTGIAQAGSGTERLQAALGPLAPVAIGVRDAVQSLWGGLSLFGSGIASVVGPALSGLGSSLGGIQPILDNFKAGWLALQPILEPLGAFIGGVLVGALSTIAPVVRLASEAFRLIGEAVGWAGTQLQPFVPQIQTIGEVVGFVFSNVILAAVTDGIGSIVEIIPVVGRIGEAFKAAGSVASEAFAPEMALIATAVSGAGAAISSLWTEYVSPAVTQIGAGVSSLWNDYLQPYLVQNWPVVVDAWSGAFSTFQSVLTTAFSVIGQMFQAVWPVLVSAFQYAVPIFQELGGIIASALVPAFQTFWPLVQQWAQIFGPVLKPALEGIALVIGALVAGPLIALAAGFTAVVLAVSGLVAGGAALISFFISGVSGAVQLGGALVNLGSTALGGLRTGFEATKTYLSGWWTSIEAFFVNGAHAVVDGLLTGLQAAAQVFHTVFDPVLDYLRPWWDLVKALFHEGPLIVSALLSAGWSAVASETSSIWDGIKTYLSGWWSWLQSTLISPALTWVETNLSSAWTSVSDTATQIWDGIKSYLGGWWSWFQDTLLTPAISWVETNLSAAWTSVSDTATQIWDGIKSYLQGWWDWLENTLISPAVSWLETNLSSAWSWISTNVTSVWDSIKSYLSSWWSDLESLVSTAISGLETGLSAAWSSIASAASTGWGIIRDNIVNPMVEAYNKVVSVVDSIIDAVAGVLDGVHATESAGALREFKPKAITAFGVGGGQEGTSGAGGGVQSFAGGGGREPGHTQKRIVEWGEDLDPGQREYYLTEKTEHAPRNKDLWAEYGSRMGFLSGNAASFATGGAATPSAAPPGQTTGGTAPVYGEDFTAWQHYGHLKGWVPREIAPAGYAPDPKLPWVTKESFAGGGLMEGKIPPPDDPEVDAADQRGMDATQSTAPDWYDPRALYDYWTSDDGEYSAPSLNLPYVLWNDVSDWLGFASGGKVKRSQSGGAFGYTYAPWSYTDSSGTQSGVIQQSSGLGGGGAPSGGSATSGGSSGAGGGGGSTTHGGSSVSGSSSSSGSSSGSAPSSGSGGSSGSSSQQPEFVLSFGGEDYQRLLKDVHQDNWQGWIADFMGGATPTMKQPDQQQSSGSASPSSSSGASGSGGPTVSPSVSGGAKQSSTRRSSGGVGGGAPASGSPHGSISGTGNFQGNVIDQSGPGQQVFGWQGGNTQNFAGGGSRTGDVSLNFSVTDSASGAPRTVPSSVAAAAAGGSGTPPPAPSASRPSSAGGGSSGSSGGSSASPAQGSQTPDSASNQASSATQGALAAAVSYAQAQFGLPYIYGDAGPDGYDCSGIVDSVFDVYTSGQPSYSHWAGTYDWYAGMPGWSPGVFGDMSVGVTLSGGGGPDDTHMAMTVGGQNVESNSYDNVTGSGMGASDFSTTYSYDAANSGATQKFARGGFRSFASGGSATRQPDAPVQGDPPQGGFLGGIVSQLTGNLPVADPIGELWDTFTNAVSGGKGSPSGSGSGIEIAMNPEDWQYLLEAFHKRDWSTWIAEFARDAKTPSGSGSSSAGSPSPSGGTSGASSGKGSPQSMVNSVMSGGDSAPGGASSGASPSGGPSSGGGSSSMMPSGQSPSTGGGVSGVGSSGTAISRRQRRRQRHQGLGGAAGFSTATQYAPADGSDLAPSLMGQIIGEPGPIADRLFGLGVNTIGSGDFSRGFARGGTRLQSFAEGGLTDAQIQNAIDVGDQAIGDFYAPGMAGPPGSGYNCSGLWNWIESGIPAGVGDPTYRWGTNDMPVAGWESGTGQITTGVSMGGWGGPDGSHMAGNVNGTGFEADEVYGVSHAGISGADPMAFDNQYFLGTDKYVGTSGGTGPSLAGIARKLMDVANSAIIDPLFAGTWPGGLVGEGLKEGIKSTVVKPVEDWVLSKVPGGGASGGTAGSASGVTGGASLPAEAMGWLQQGLKDTGVDPSWLPGLEDIMSQESDGQNIANLEGSGAMGPMQMMPGTFDANALLGHTDINNPQDNVDAAIRYIEAAYGTPDSVPGIGDGVGYISYSEGGIALGPQKALFGESGAEAMIPLDGGPQLSNFLSSLPPSALANAGYVPPAGGSGPSADAESLRRVVQEEIRNQTAALTRQMQEPTELANHDAIGKAAAAAAYAAQGSPAGKANLDRIIAEGLNFHNEFLGRPT